MTRALLAAALTLSLCAVASAGPREQTGPSQIPSVPGLGAAAPALSQAVLPVTTLAPAAGVSGPAAIPTLPAAAAQAAPAQAAAAAAPPAGPPNGPSTAAAPPSGPPPGGPGRGPDEGPVPGPAGTEQQAAGGERRAALTQLKAELSALEKEQRRLDTTAARIAVGQKDAPSVEAMRTADDAKRKAAALSPRIQAKRDELRQAAQADRTAYRVLKDQLSALKSEREKSLAAAKSAGVVGGEFKGGAAEARARALEHAQDLQAQIDRKKKALSLMERDNPGLAGLRAPIVAAKNAFGLAPQTDAERKLAAEIRELDAAADEKQARAQSLFKTEAKHPDMGAAEEGFQWLKVAKKDRAAADAKRAELKKLRGK